MENRKPDKIDEWDTKIWYDSNDELHNENGYPAIICSNRTKWWYKHGLRHNDFGPAHIYSWGEKEWFIDDEKYTEEEFKQHKIKQFIDG